MGTSSFNSTDGLQLTFSDLDDQAALYQSPHDANVSVRGPSLSNGMPDRTPPDPYLVDHR
jgi:hypothetical protein